MFHEALRSIILNHSKEARHAVRDDALLVFDVAHDESASANLLDKLSHFHATSVRADVRHLLAAANSVSPAAPETHGRTLNLVSCS